jgi:hypothetical protein
MRAIWIFVLSAGLVGGAALAQTASPTNNPAANAVGSNPARAAPAQAQPQGHSGPITTTTGGAPASSPQGDSPPGMQPSPKDPKQGIDPKK